MFGMCKTKHISKCKPCLFIISKIDIFDLVEQSPSSLIINFEQVIKPFSV